MTAAQMYNTYVHRDPRWLFLGWAPFPTWRRAWVRLGQFGPATIGPGSHD